jgi:uncharacterized phage-associated protein
MFLRPLKYTFNTIRCGMPTILRIWYHIRNSQPVDNLYSCTKSGLEFQTRRYREELMSNNAPQRVVYKPTWVANSFLVRAQKDGVDDIDPLKIQKLVYNLHGWHLAVTGHPVIGERFEAWPHGPVNSTIYHQFKNFKFRPINVYATDIDPTTGKNAATYVAPSDSRFYDVFDRVWDRYKGFTGQELSNFTHAVGTPWSYAREHDLQYIPDELIRNHFIDLSNVAA